MTTHSVNTADTLHSQESTARSSSTASENEPIAERVHNRSLRPKSHTFEKFMTEGWDVTKQDIKPNESSKYIPTRLKELGNRFPGERIIIPAGTAKVRNNDCDFPFRPDTTFVYYTGLGEDQEPGAVLVLEPSDKSDALGGHEPILFLHPRADQSTPDFFRSASYGEYWIGARPGLEEFSIMTGLATRNIDELDKFLEAALSDGTVPPLRIIKEADPSLTQRVEAIRHKQGQTDSHANDTRDDELHNVAAVARMIKDSYEIEQMRQAIEATKHGFDNILRALPKAVDHPRGERILEAAFNSIARIEGNDVGYGTIVASGSDAPTLHWMRNTHTVLKGDLLLIDAGVETTSLYTADITRTFPVGGTFSDLQKKLYQAVFDAQQAGFEAAQPGHTYSDIHHACMKSLAQSLKDWDVLPVSVEESLSEEGQHHRRWHACGVAHHLGLDVHDCAQARYEEYQGAKIMPGMIFTIEPGLYFRENDLMLPEELRGIGIRIEDDVLMTENGPQWLSKPLIPSTIEEVEAWMAHMAQEVVE